MNVQLMQLLDRQWATLCVRVHPWIASPMSLILMIT